MPSDRNYWVRTEHGRIWGPFTVTALERLRGQLSEKCEASIDGKEWHPGLDFPELRDLLSPARKIERKAPGEVTAAPRITKAMAEAFGLERTPMIAPDADAPAAKPPPAPAAAPAPKKAPPPPPPAEEVKLEVPASGDLAQHTPARLYALAALTSATGALVLQLEKGRTLRIAFRRGTPEHVASDDADLSLPRFLQTRGALTPEKASAAEAFAAKSGQDVLAVLFQMQLLPPADAHRHLAEHATFLLDRAMVSWRGTFTFEKDAAPPPGAFPLGSKWPLLTESVRRVEVPLLRARLGKRLTYPVVRSGGLSIGKLEDLALNAQETRLYAAIDGTKTGEDLLKAQDTSLAVRVLYLLTELGHVSFAELEQQEPPPPPAPAAAPKPAAAAPPARELPKTAREVGRVPPPAPKAPAPPRAAPPVMQAAPKPAAKPVTGPIVTRPPPTFAQPPPNETPDAAVNRLGALWERLAEADHYAVLGMERKSATAAEAKRNFFVLAKELHPDTVSDPAQVSLKEIKERLFARINEAAQVLGDDKRRKEYEAELDGKANSVDVSRIFAAEENFQKAEILIKAHKYQQGLELLEQAIQMNADEAEFYAWRGYAKFLLSADRKQAFEDCAGDCRKAIKMVDRCLPAHLFLGQMSKVLGDLKQAKKCFQRVLELDEKHIEAQRELRLMGQK